MSPHEASPSSVTVSASGGTRILRSLRRPNHTRFRSPIPTPPKYTHSGLRAGDTVTASRSDTRADLGDQCLAVIAVDSPAGKATVKDAHGEKHTVDINILCRCSPPSRRRREHGHELEEDLRPRTRSRTVRSMADLTRVAHDGWRVEQEAKIRQIFEKLAVGLQTPAPPLLLHFFLGHRQVSGGSQIGELYEIFTSRLGLKCWRDLSQTLQDVEAMIRGVAESSVYLLYLTHDALSYFVTIEARAAMMLDKPVIVMMQNDSRKDNYAGGSLESALQGWPQDLHDYLRTACFVAWEGQPFEWRRHDQNAKLKTVLDWCAAVGAQVPAASVGWGDAATNVERVQ